jgi:peptidoglycan/LPS O-acetylase OafA/YrhL
MWFGYYSPITRFPEFIAGCCSGAIYMKIRGSAGAPLLDTIGGYTALALFIFGVALFSINLKISYPIATMLMRVVPVVAISYLLIFVSRRASVISHSLSLPWIVSGGEISYSIYLVHPFVLGWFVKPEQPEISLVGFAQWTITMITAGLCVIVLSCGTYTTIEYPARRWLRDKLMKAAVVPLNPQIPAAGAVVPEASTVPS